MIKEYLHIRLDLLIDKTFVEHDVDFTSPYGKEYLKERLLPQIFKLPYSVRSMHDEEIRIMINKEEKC